jgi:hypothetical protein
VVQQHHLRTKKMSSSRLQELVTRVILDSLARPVLRVRLVSQDRWVRKAQSALLVHWVLKALRVLKGQSASLDLLVRRVHKEQLDSLGRWVLKELRVLLDLPVHSELKDLRVLRGILDSLDH